MYNEHAFQKVYNAVEAHVLWQLKVSVIMAEALMAKVLPKPSDTTESRHYLHSLTVNVTSLSVPWIGNCPASVLDRQLPASVSPKPLVFNSLSALLERFFTRKTEDCFGRDIRVDCVPCTVQLSAFPLSHTPGPRLFLSYHFPTA